MVSTTSTAKFKPLPESCSRNGGQDSGKSSTAWDSSAAPSSNSPSTLSGILCYIIFSLTPPPPIPSPRFHLSLSLTVFILGLTGPMAMFGQCSKSPGALVRGPGRSTASLEIVIKECIQTRAMNTRIVYIRPIPQSRNSAPL